MCSQKNLSADFYVNEDGESKNFRLQVISFRIALKLSVVVPVVHKYLTELKMRYV